MIALLCLLGVLVGGTAEIFLSKTLYHQVDNQLDQAMNFGRPGGFHGGSFPDPDSDARDRPFGGSVLGSIQLTHYPDEDAVHDGPRTVLITGANGNIGRKLREAWDDVYDLVLIDLESDPDDPDVIAADLSELDEEWMEAFHGVDTVVHLAGNPDEHATWEDLYRPNIDALHNVFQAAALAGVERIVFASSNHAMGGYRELGDMPITVELPPKPDGPYGATKLMGERLGRTLSGIFEMTFVALRLGWVQAGENRPETLPDDWNKELWLSNADMVRLFARAVEAGQEIAKRAAAGGPKGPPPQLVESSAFLVPYFLEKTGKKVEAANVRKESKNNQDTYGQEKGDVAEDRKSVRDQREK